MTDSDRVLYLGTSLIPIAGISAGVEGIYRLTLNGEPKLVCLGLQDQGWVVPPVLDRDDRDTIYAGTARGGVFRSADGGRTWRETNRGLVYKEVWSLAQHPLTGELFVGTQPAAIFRSQDRGDTWQECEYLRGMFTRKDWSFPGPPFIAHVKYLDLPAADPSLLFAAVEEGWLLRSTDGGDTWLNVKLGTAFDAHSVTVMPDDPTVVLHTGGTGVYRSTDGGERFEQIRDGIQQSYMTPVALHPDRPAVLFAAAAEVPPPFWRRPDGGNSAFYRSDDQGRSWRTLTGGLPEHLSAAPRWVTVDPADPDTVYFCMSDGTLWLTRDGGEKFDLVQLGTLPAITGVTCR